MPTPRPTMVATIGAEVLTSMVLASRVTPDDPTARPVNATTRGRPAATTEPKASTSSTSATTTPAISPVPFISEPPVAGSSPPSSVWRPEASVGASAFSSWSTPALPMMSGSVVGTS